MIITYEIGGDDFHPGEDYDLELDHDQVVEALVDYMADNYLFDCKKNNKLFDKSPEALRTTKKSVKDVLKQTFKDFELITEEVESNNKDIIKEYYEEKAYEEWANSNY
jgi:hypothetical protein